MNVISNRRRALTLSAFLTLPLAAGLSAQQPVPVPAQADTEVITTVYAPDLPPIAELGDGPDVEGIITARRGERLQVTAKDGTNTTVILHKDTRIRAKGGFLGLGGETLASDQLLNGIPVKIDTLEWRGGLVAGKIALSDDDLETAQIVRAGTDQRFGEQGASIQKNTAATEALRGRFGDIDKYDVVQTTNVYFDTGKSNLSPAARRELCATATQAEQNDNSLLLIVGYTDSTGSQEVNQVLSDKRAGSVVNFLQQQCKWKPYRVLTPTGMAASDPVADNRTAAGKAQNRRVAVNVLVSKSLEGL